MSYYGIPTGRVKGICSTCHNDDDAYESEKCMSCKHNPWLDDNYEKKEAESGLPMR